MGILDINPTLEKADPNIRKPVNAEKFYGTRIYVDAYRWLYANMSIAHKSVIMETDVLREEPNRKKSFKLLIQIFLDFYLKWVSLKMYPVIGFDGKSAPEKCSAHKKRNKAKLATQEKIDAFKEKLKTQDLLTMPDPREYKKLLAQKNWVSKDEIAEFKELVKNLGIPYLVATGEAEKLGSSLVIEGKCSTIFTTDTDPLAYGSPSMIQDLRSESTSASGPLFNITETRLDDCYRVLGIGRDKFVDFCILLGCDYNDRIFGYGPVKALKLIKDHGSIEKIREAGIDISSLNFEFCRKEFSYVQSGELIESGTLICREIEEKQMEMIREVLGKYGFLGYIDKILRCNESIPKEIEVKSIRILGMPKLNLMGIGDVKKEKVEIIVEQKILKDENNNDVNLVKNKFIALTM